jgi:hypothetical protein
MSGAGTVGDPTVPGDVTYPYIYNGRNHRLDTLSFFARDLFHRQTGNPGTFVDNMAATEAWIWYGHLQLPDNTGAYPPSSGNTVQPSSMPHRPPVTYPCMGNPALNPNNYFGGQLVLGRMAMLLVPASSNNVIQDPSGTPQYYLNSQGNGLAPLYCSSPVNQSLSGLESDLNNKYLYQGRLDIVNGSIISTRSQLASASAPYLPNGQANPAYDQYWYTNLLDGLGEDSPYGGRFQCNPFVSKPMQSADMAHASPYFLGGCSQFMVEFAGDYVSQVTDPTSVNYGMAKYPGSPASAAPDGQIDFTVITDPSTHLKRKQIIWYGLPRNTSGRVSSTNSQYWQGCEIDNGDVAPLYYWLTAPTTMGGFGITFSNTAGNYYPYGFEKVSPAFQNPSDLTSMEANSQYICAWGPNDVKPKLIRITMTLEDPTGRLPEGQTYQYVFAVP